MPRIAINNIEKLEMELSDGTIKEALFNYDAIKIFAREFGNIDEEESMNKPYDFAAKILYSGMKVLDKSVTLEEAEMLLIGGGDPLMREVTNSLVDNFMSNATEEQKEIFMKEADRYIKELMSKAN